MTPTEAQVEALTQKISRFTTPTDHERVIARYVLSLTGPLLHALEQCAAGAFVVSDRERLTNVAKAALADYQRAVGGGA